MKTKTFFILTTILAVFLVSGCTQSTTNTNNTANVGGNVNNANANWCPIGMTTTNNVGGGTQTWTFKSTENYVFSDGTINVCCMEGQTNIGTENFKTRMCVDQGSKHSVQWRSYDNVNFVKLVETYPKGAQTCIVTFDLTGVQESETCQ